MSNQEADFCLVCGVKPTTTPLPCALCMLRAQHGMATELPSEQTSGQDHRRAGSQVTALYFEGSYKYVYFLKLCSAPNLSLSDLRMLLSQMWGLLLKPLLKLGSRPGEQCSSHLHSVWRTMWRTAAPTPPPALRVLLDAAGSLCCKMLLPPL